MFLSKRFIGMLVGNGKFYLYVPACLNFKSTLFASSAVPTSFPLRISTFKFFAVGLKFPFVIKCRLIGSKLPEASSNFEGWSDLRRTAFRNASYKLGWPSVFAIRPRPMCCSSPTAGVIGYLEFNGIVRDLTAGRCRLCYDDRQSFLRCPQLSIRNR